MGYGIIDARLSKIKSHTKSMQLKQFPRQFYRLRAIVCAFLLVALIGGAAVVKADQFDEKINALQQQNNSAQGVLNGLASQASSYQDTINKLQAQIRDVEAKIAANEAAQAKLLHKIAVAKHQIALQKKYLGQDIKAMYIDGQLSTIEELATSKNLSEYVDKEEYRIAAQNKINDTIEEIAVLKAKLQKQKAKLDSLIDSQKQQNAQLSGAEAQKQRLLSYNQGQQDAYNSQIAANSSQIAELRRQQIIANSRFSGGAPGSGPTCGGGYPAKWCQIPQDSVIDDWGMYNRECVSYTAFRVAASGRNMPYWGGRGNANQWDDNARAAGIPTDTRPRVGDVAISNSGFYGHAMYVEAVNSNGTIFISQYNASLDGRFSTNTISPSGLYFIHFR
jgi:peptidoglycan DL-endopeptidase CwlO